MGVQNEIKTLENVARHQSKIAKTTIFEDCGVINYFAGKLINGRARLITSDEFISALCEFFIALDSENKKSKKIKDSDLCDFLVNLRIECGKLDIYLVKGIFDDYQKVAYQLGSKMLKFTKAFNKV